MDDDKREYSNMEEPEDVHSPKSVKSTAIVKYSAVQTPANFARLQCNTDLNSPPSNWLSSSADSYGLQHVLSHSTGFSSFRMAHMFPDCVGEVDVVSDAENIKNLLKLPYSQGPVSMMVHRIENTLLIDDFDIHKHLLRTAETEWDWLKKFFFDNIQKALNEKDRCLYRRSKSRNVLQQKSLMSKFLYHSLVESTKREHAKDMHGEPSTPLPLSGPALPEPSVEEEVPDPTTKHKYNRNVVWTFEDIQMLIGTDLPIFGGSTHPCISLRLRDMNKPISVLTGIDYWLDNLMSNVPEVVMCYHLNGIVQRYEVIKTEDLPHLDDSKFSPKLIRDIAQNILSFLKSNATKAGHTYWLFKGRNDDVVKLYDLTSLCTGVLDEKGQNPFTVPVAMLLYRVARNMKHSTDGASQLGTIKMLLKNCIELLNKEKYPQIVTSSHYMLSDLYVPAHTNPTEPGFESPTNEQYDESTYDDDLEDSSIQSSEAIKQLRLGEAPDPDVEGFKYKAAPPLTGSIKERCLNALHHVALGLKCLKYFPSNIFKTKEFAKEQEKQQKLAEERNLKMAHPFEPIPMPYSSINAEKSSEGKGKKSKKRLKTDKRGKKVVDHETESPRALLPKPKAEALPTWQEPDRSDDASWHAHLKTLLYEKACLVYAILAEQEYMEENYGNSLRYISVLVRCQKVLKTLQCSLQHVQESCLLGRAGDCCCMIEKHWSKVDAYTKQYFYVSDVEQAMVEEINKDYPEENEIYEQWNGLLPLSIDNNEQMLQISCRCYERALASEPGTERRNLLRRLGNVHNELGTLYMNQACAEVNNGCPNVQTLISKSLYNLEAGIRSFESINDKANLALLHSNMGRLMRLCAHINSNDAEKKKEIVGPEKMYYNKALSSYQKARQVLLNRRTNPDIWDAITWELSTASYNMATLLQDYPTLGSRTTKELEQEVVELLHKALEYCDMETPTYRQPIYQFRGAKIHHRLASLYHNSFRRMTSFDTRRKSTIMLCKLHYERATSIMATLEDTPEYFNVHLEYFALYQLLFQNSTSVTAKYKYLILGLNLLTESLPMLKLIAEKSNINIDASNQTNGITHTKLNDHPNDVNEKENDKTDSCKESSEPSSTAKLADEKENNLMSLLETQLQFILLNLTKLFSKPAKGITADHCSTYGTLFKKLYSLSLRIGINNLQGPTLAQHLVKIIQQISESRSKVPELTF